MRNMKSITVATGVVAAIGFWVGHGRSSLAKWLKRLRRWCLRLGRQGSVGEVRTTGLRTSGLRPAIRGAALARDAVTLAPFVAAPSSGPSVERRGRGQHPTRRPPPTPRGGRGRPTQPWRSGSTAQLSFVASTAPAPCAASGSSVDQQWPQRVAAPMRSCPQTGHLRSCGGGPRSSFLTSSRQAASKGRVAASPVLVLRLASLSIS